MYLSLQIRQRDFPLMVAFCFLCMFRQKSSWHTQSPHLWESSSYRAPHKKPSLFQPFLEFAPRYIPVRIYPTHASDIRQRTLRTRYIFRDLTCGALQKNEHRDHIDSHTNDSQCICSDKTTIRVYFSSFPDYDTNHSATDIPSKKQ